MATNGLGPHDDLLAVGLVYCTVDELGLTTAGKIVKYLTVSDEAIAKAYPYHQISPELIREYGKSADDVKAELKSLFEPSIILTYNPGFQETFLSKVYDDTEMLDMYDWTRIEKSVRNCKVYQDAECADAQTFMRTCEGRFNPMPVNKYFRIFNLKSSVPGETRLDRMLELSKEVFSSIVSTEFEVLVNSDEG